MTFDYLRGVPKHVGLKEGLPILMQGAWPEEPIPPQLKEATRRRD